MSVSQASLLEVSGAFVEAARGIDTIVGSTQWVEYEGGPCVN
jgi:hypothetical protein